jgi:hypothetical protein
MDGSVRRGKEGNSIGNPLEYHWNSIGILLEHMARNAPATG